MTGQELTNTKKPDLQEIIKKAETITDDTAKAVISCLLELVQDEKK